MGLLFKIVPPRKFQYRPRYYNPEREVDPERARRRKHIRRLWRHPRRANKPIMLWVLFAIATLYFYWQWRNSIGANKPLQVEPIRVEEVNP